MSRGIERERKVRRLLEAEGWWTCRAAGSFGDADVVAIKANLVDYEPDEPYMLSLVRMIEVKSTAAGPYHGFGPAQRAELSAAAEKAGAEAFLYWWPPRKLLQIIPEADWPQIRKAA